MDVKSEWKPIDGITPPNLPLLVAKMVDYQSGEGWTWASFDYAVASRREDGSLVGWNDDRMLEGYTLWCSFSPPALDQEPTP